MNRGAFQKLAKARLVDARVLLKARRFDAAYYMAGYSVECALKACIARRTRRFDFPPKDVRDLYAHDLFSLVRSAGIDQPFTRERQNDPILSRYREVVKDWKPDSRYDSRGQRASVLAKELLTAIEESSTGSYNVCTSTGRRADPCGVCDSGRAAKGWFPHLRNVLVSLTGIGLLALSDRLNVD